MTLFESLKLFPKVDLHIDFLGSISKDTVYELTKNKNNDTLESINNLFDFDSLTEYNNSKQLAIRLLNNYENIAFALNKLIKKLEQDNLYYGEIFINLDLFLKKLDKEKIITVLLEEIKKTSIKLNLVLEIDSNLEKEELYNNLSIVYKYYNHGINGVYFKKSKLDNLETYKSIFDKFTKDNIDYILLLDTKLTKGDKEIYYNAKRIIYNVFEKPDDVFLDIIRENNIILEFPITYQSYFNIYDELKNHFIYELYKENILISFTTMDMSTLDTDLLNEYCKIFNVFPFSLRDLVVINLNVLSNVNISFDIKNSLIEDYREKANELL